MTIEAQYVTVAAAVRAWGVLRRVAPWGNALVACWDRNTEVWGEVFSR